MATDRGWIWGILGEKCWGLSCQKMAMEEVYGRGEEDMQVVGMTEEDVEDRSRWRKMICCGDP